MSIDTAFRLFRPIVVVLGVRELMGLVLVWNEVVAVGILLTSQLCLDTAYQLLVVVVEVINENTLASLEDIDLRTAW